MASCVNSDYDFNEVDATMGFGGEGLELPGSSTDTIKLADVLDLGDDDCVKVRPNGDYVFEQVGDNVEPAQPEIAPISVTQRQSVSYDIDINVEPATRSAGDARSVTVVLSADGDMQSFEYDGDKPAEVVGLDYAETDANLSFSLHFPAGLSSVVASLDEISIQMPSFMELSDVSANIGADGSWSIDGSRIVFSNITTSRDLTVSARVSRLRFGVSDELGSLGIDGDKIVLDGRVHVSMNSVATVSGGSIEGLTASSDFAIDDMQITSVTGRFDPEIDLDNLGDVEITGVPDFLTDGNVRVDLYNPQILLTLNSDLNMGGFVGGTLTSWKDGQPIASVTVPEMAVRAGGMTEMCICRNGEGIEGFDVVQVVPELSTLIDTIPDRITFEGTARADRNQTLKALAEAEAYHGPSLIIGYAPCEMHGIKGGMTNCQNEMKKAVDAGYWNMFRYNPALKAEGKNPFILDSKPATASYKDFISGETRYSRLARSFPDRAADLFDKAEKRAAERYEQLAERAKGE